ncbi:hypothetical protein GDO86_009614 [Hymenochirus boettgeri]|uniref:Tubulin-specific chaperone E n=2 Tax=Hymenochirus TaxID=8361 RepID=A0A8T2JQ01_9PIPI|nr:hypothetical protein GDO86_009614 [Hymenochirus boettgeri]
MNIVIPSDATGRRIICDGEFGTVHYVGNVPPTPGLWLGIEWDNPVRGKHDGTHEGTKYFTCSHPTGGSFIRPKKANFGVDFVTALRKRYGLKIDQNEELKLNKLRDISVRECTVSHAGEKGEIKQICPNIITADLSKNLFSSWENLADIACQLNNLKSLDLSENKLHLSANPSSLADSFLNLKVLSLKHTGLSWEELLNCASMWPALEELHLTSNDIQLLERPVDNLQNLVTLDISNNKLVDGNQLHALAYLPRLKQVILSNNSVSSVSFPDVEFGHKTSMFPSLNSLSIDGNNISQWSVINELNKLVHLQSLNCRGNPFMDQEKNPETVRQLIIAKIENLKFLNKTEILPKERRGAELDYRKMFGSDWLKATESHTGELKNRSRDFLIDHPRYSALIDKYGAIDEGELKQQQPFALKNQLLTLTIRCPEKPDQKPIQKKLPDSMTVQKVKGLLYRLLKVPGSLAIKLSYESSKMEGKEIELENDLKALQFYSLENGDCMLVRW